MQCFSKAFQLFDMVGNYGLLLFNIHSQYTDVLSVIQYLLFIYIYSLIIFHYLIVNVKVICNNQDIVLIF